MLIKIYGERNSGTRYLQKLIKSNLDVNLLRGVAPPKIVRLIAEGQKISKEAARGIYFAKTFDHFLGWKHAQAKSVSQLQKFAICKQNITFVSITKNPYAWLLSLYKRPYHQSWRRSLDFETFLTTPWPTLPRENADPIISNPVALWNHKNRSYTRLKNGLKALNLTYEAVLKDPFKTLEDICNISGCKQLNNTFVKIDRLSSKQNQGFDFFQQYYLREQWRKSLSQTAIAIINESLDEQLLDHFGYRKLSF
ncbi:MAG: hypothetical protein KDE48_07175 [Anaerolineales bacterium]|nr:hypothetical protein [Anaerolineales bacterium]